jgi:protein phosphatase
MTAASLSWERSLDVASRSDIGMRRTNNQDSFVVSMASNPTQWDQRGHLLVVADGMGAHAAGELASRLAVDHVAHLYYKFPEQSAPEALRRAMIEANAEINRRGQANEEFHNMGTTCSALVLLPQGAIIGHIGDSRVYRLRQNRLEQLTFDHSLLWEMRASGQLTRENEVAINIPKNVITRSLGPYPEVRIDLEGPFPIEPGDTFLICSDGLTGQVSDDELGPILASLPPREAAQVLIDLANLRGGPDNITLIIAKIMANSRGNHEAKPLTIGVKRRSFGPLAVWWAIFVSCLAIAVILYFAMGRAPAAAAVPALAALAALIWIFIQASGVLSRGTVVAPGKRFGRGPYSRTDCASGQKLLEQLDIVTSQLREAAIEENWQIDLAKLDAFIQQARAAAARKQESDAIRQFACSISFLMEQLRGKDRASDSNIDL